MSAHSRWPLTTGVAQGRYYCTQCHANQWTVISFSVRDNVGLRSIFVGIMAYTQCHANQWTVISFSVRDNVGLRSIFVGIMAYTQCHANQWTVISFSVIDNVGLHSIFVCIMTYTQFTKNYLSNHTHTTCTHGHAHFVPIY